MKSIYRNISQYSGKILQYIAIHFSCIMTPLLSSISKRELKVTINVFHLHEHLHL